MVNTSYLKCIWYNGGCFQLGSVFSCDLRVTKSQCWDESECLWNGASEECDEACGEEEEGCNEYVAENGRCYYNSGEGQCLFVEYDQTCNMYGYAELCQNAEYCWWNSSNNQCYARTCQNISCTSTSVSAYSSGSPSNYVFCKYDGNSCVSANPD